MADVFVNSVILPLLPQSLADFIRVYILDPRSSFQVYSKDALANAQRLLEALLPHLQPLYDRATLALSDAASSEGPAAVIAMMPLVLGTIFIIFTISFTMRLISWWTRLVTRLAFWAVIGILLLGVWERGLLQSVRDVVVVASKLAGYGAAVRDIWMREYQHYEEQSRSSARAQYTRR